jgi:hypothetical protein
MERAWGEVKGTGEWDSMGRLKRTVKKKKNKELHNDVRYIVRGN